MAKNRIRLARPSLTYAVLGILLGFGQKKEERGGCLGILLRPVYAWLYLTYEGLSYNKSRMQFELSNFKEPSSLWDFIVLTLAGGWREIQTYDPDQFRFEARPGWLWTRMEVYNVGDPDRNEIIVANDGNLRKKIRKWVGRGKDAVSAKNFQKEVGREADFLEAVDQERKRRQAQQTGS